MNDDLRDRVTDALRGHDARYIDIRLDETETTRIRYRGLELEEVARNTGIGGCVRVLAQGWGFANFNNVSDLRRKVAAAVHHASLVGGDPVGLAPVKPLVDSVPLLLAKDPRLISLQSKKDVLDPYNRIMWDTPGITTTTIGYSDQYTRKIFASSEGAYIQQEKVDVTLRVSATARNDGDVQQSSISLGSNGDFSLIENLQSDVQGVAEKAVALLGARQVRGGEYTVILDPILAGVFIHEAFGHLSEADHVYENQQLREVMVFGRRFGGSHLNVVDGALEPGLRGSYKYDDEGVPSCRTYLLQGGVLVGRLHSRETAFALNEATTGNARAINPRFPPIVRMTNTYIEPGDATVQELVEDIKDGLYVRNWYGGMTSMEQFTFSSGEAYVIRKGRIEELVRPVLLSGNVFSTLNNLDGVANDLDMNQGGGCGKSGQSPLPVSNGSPHIRIRKCLVGGS